MMRSRCERNKYGVRVFGPAAMAFFIWMVAAGATISHGAEIVDRIVAVVNDDIITLSEFNHTLKPYLDRVKSRGYDAGMEGAALSKLKKDILNNLIDQTLTDQEVKKAGLAVGDEEIDDATNRIKEINFYSDQDFKRALAEQGLSLEEYRENVKNQILRSRIVHREIRSKIVITQEEVKNYYEAHSEDYGREYRYHLRNIIMRLPRTAGEAEKRQVLKRMTAVLEKLERGEPFENLARQYSESNLAVDGGDLGFFKKESLSPQIRAALQNLREGDYTPILETDQGYQIFYIQEIEVIPGRPLAEVSVGIQEKLFAEKVEKRFENWLEELRKRSHIKVIE